VSVPPQRDGAHQDPEQEWPGLRAAVLGSGPAAFAVADNLTHLGASVVVLSESEASADDERAQLLGMLGIELRLGPGSTADLPDVEALVLAPGAEDRDAVGSLLEQARSRDVRVLGEVELAWRLRDRETAPAWIVVTGHEGAATTARVLEQMLLAAGLPVVLAGEVGLPLVEAVMDPSPYAVLVAALDAFQLERAGAMQARSAAVLASGEASLGRVYEGVEIACVYRPDDLGTEELVREADVIEGARAIGVTLSTPGVGMVGVVEDVLADRAFVADRQSSAAELGTMADLASAEPAFVTEALTAAALARSLDVEPVAIREGLRRFRP
jgi:UDP-N-acetylmuramoylalanine--D-glutamate ligase